MIASAGIIAAGEGTRLRSLFPDRPKPLVPVQGKPLIEWVVSGLNSAGISSVTLLHNSAGKPLREFLKSRFKDIRWTFLEKNTQSSWESFRLVSGAMAQMSRRCLISTADALISPEDVLRFSREAERSETAEAAVALTRFVDDEKPLRADMGADGWITAMGPSCRSQEFVTCGLYMMSRELALARPPAEAYSRLRDFWAATVIEGRRILGVPLSKTVDVDRPEDLPAAEQFLKSLSREAEEGGAMDKERPGAASKV